MERPEFDDCLKRRKIVRFPSARKLAVKELDIAKADLAASRKSYKWAAVQAYYAMFHAARTLLYHKGY